jgi:hypothetical protein
MSEQGDRDRNLAFDVGHLQTLEAAYSALSGDISALRQAILKGSQVSLHHRENLIRHLKQTLVLLSAATQACNEIIVSITKPIK